METQLQMNGARRTLQWQDADAKVLQLAEGADEVQLVLDDPGTVGDQLEARPGMAGGGRGGHEGGRE